VWGSVGACPCMSYQLIQSDNRWSSQRGLMVVEAAFVTLLFLIFMLGIFEGGRVLSVQQALNNAAREGALIAVMPESQTSALPSGLRSRMRLATIWEPRWLREPP